MGVLENRTIASMDKEDALNFAVKYAYAVVNEIVKCGQDTKIKVT